MDVRIRKLSPLAVAPKYATEGSAGMDLHACMAEPITIWPGFHEVVPTGLVLELPPGHEGQVRPRSGLAARVGLTVLNAPGTIDSDYRGEVGVLLINHGHKSMTIQPGDRIAQLVIAPCVRVTWVEVAELEATARGAGGFGSSGTR